MDVEQTSGWIDAKKVVAGTPEWRHPQRPPFLGQPLSGVKIFSYCQRLFTSSTYLKRQAVFYDNFQDHAILQPIQIREEILHLCFQRKISQVLLSAGMQVFAEIRLLDAARRRLHYWLVLHDLNFIDAAEVQFLA